MFTVSIHPFSVRRRYSMNTIDVQPVTTLYGYSESYWLIDGKPIVRYLDEYVRDGKCPALERFGSLLGLLPAWSGELEWAAENRFIWEMIDSPGTQNVPILVCEDDCDLSCIVILARIRKTEDFIFWDKIGLLLHENEDFDLEQRAGIANLDSYSEKDWEMYGGNIAWEEFGSREFFNWVGENWQEELLRRRRNYTLPYMQKDGNIFWIEDVNWVFTAGQYNHMVEKFREIYRQNQ